MKKIGYLVLIILFFLPVLAQTVPIDPPVARIKLIRVEVITQMQFKEKIDYLEKLLKKPIEVEKRRELLDSLIDEMLILQGADRDKIGVSDTEVQTSVENYRKQLGIQYGLNRALTEAEIQSLLVKQGITWEKFVSEIKKKAIMEKYIMQTKATKFKSIPEPTETEIVDFFESNRSKFVSPEMIKFKQIVIITKSMTAEQKAKAKTKIESIYKDLAAGSSFDKYMDVYISEGAERAGGISYETWAREDERVKTAYGKDFFTNVFKMKVGERSAIVESSVGYHIIEIIEKIPYTPLELVDKIPPQYNMTVRQYIAKLIVNQKQVELFKQATEEIRTELRKQAEVNIYEENLNW